MCVCTVCTHIWIKTDCPLHTYNCQEGEGERERNLRMCLRIKLSKQISDGLGMTQQWDLLTNSARHFGLPIA